MKSSNDKPSADSAAPAGGSVADQLGTIDTSVLDELLGTRGEETRIREFRERANAMKDGVEPLVWQRVVGDYSSRLAAVEAQARPLKARARQEYAKLRVLIDRVTKEQQTAGIARAELEFRHAVGELDDGELAERMKEPAGILTRCGEELEAIGSLKSRFIEAFGSEAELETAPPPESTSPPAEAASPAGGTPTATTPADPDVTPLPATAGGDQTGRIPAAALTPDATILAAPDDLPVDATVIAPMPPTDGIEADAGATMLHAPTPAPAAADGEEHTFLLPAAALLIEGDGGAQEYRLAAVNYLGRSDDNHLQIARPGVSRRHAVVMAGAAGFVIQDLGSQNGVFVDGERVSEHPLKDGEQIVIGDSTMTFRTPWPQPSRRESRTRATKG